LVGNIFKGTEILLFSPFEYIYIFLKFLKKSSHLSKKKQKKKREKEFSCVTENRVNF